MLNRTKGQLKFPVRGEVLVLERVVEVVVHAEEEIRVVTQTVSVADVPAMKWLNVRQLDTSIIERQAVRCFSLFLFEIQKDLYENFLPLFTIFKRFQAA